jgi:hypothetical protein
MALPVRRQATVTWASITRRMVTALSPNVRYGAVGYDTLLLRNPE